MKKLIDADALKELKFPNGESEYVTGWNDAISAIMTFQPTVDAEPVRHGEWIYIYKKVPVFNYQCSECGARSILFENFCSYCGAYMRGEDD